MNVYVLPEFRPPLPDGPTTVSAPLAVSPGFIGLDGLTGTVKPLAFVTETILGIPTPELYQLAPPAETEVITVVGIVTTSWVMGLSASFLTLKTRVPSPEPPGTERVPVIVTGEQSVHAVELDEDVSVDVIVEVTVDIAVETSVEIDVAVVVNVVVIVEVLACTELICCCKELITDWSEADAALAMVETDWKDETCESSEETFAFIVAT